MKQKPEICAYCQKRRMLYLCGETMSAHCADCCPADCSGRKKPNFMDEAFQTARQMGGASWPSADCTRGAMRSLVLHLADHFEKECPRPMTGKKVAKEIMKVCGIKEVLEVCHQ